MISLHQFQYSSNCQASSFGASLGCWGFAQSLRRVSGQFPPPTLLPRWLCRNTEAQILAFVETQTGGLIHYVEVSFGDYSDFFVKNFCPNLTPAYLGLIPYFLTHFPISLCQLLGNCTNQVPDTTLNVPINNFIILNLKSVLSTKKHHDLTAEESTV